MGKSDKKIKADRINALRKQYDAFLEEDKKRKERNEFIINKLDNMRMSSSAVALRSSSPHLFRRSLTQYCGTFKNLDVSEPPTRELASRNPIVDEESVLQEITKKFILIPRHPVVENTTASLNYEPKEELVYDWRSKYEILDQLKKGEIIDIKPESRVEPEKPYIADRLTNYCKDNELKSETVIPNNEVKSNRDIIDIHPKIDNAYGINNNNYDTVAEKPLQESIYAAQNNAVDDSYVPHHTTTPIDDNNYTVVEQTLEPYNDEVNISYDDDKNVDDVIYANVKINKTRSPSNDSTEANDIDLTHKDLSSLTETYVFESNGEVTGEPIPGEEHNITEEIHNNVINEYPGPAQTVEEQYVDEIESIGVVHSENLINEVSMPTDPDNVPTHQEEYPNTVIHDESYPIEVIDPEEFTPGPNVEVEHGVNVNPPGYEQAHVAVTEEHDVQAEKHIYENVPQPTMAEHVDGQEANNQMSDNPVDDTQIQAFDQENKEMFYSEETADNAEYPQNYDNPEYQQQEYGQGDDQYAYYNEEQNVYPIESTENEADMQAYDQTYQQQYDNNVYEQDPAQPQQEYDNVVKYPQEQAYDESRSYEQLQQYENEPQAVEEILEKTDAEDGLVSPAMETAPETPSKSEMVEQPTT